MTTKIDKIEKISVVTVGLAQAFVYFSFTGLKGIGEVNYSISLIDQVVPLLILMVTGIALYLHTKNHKRSALWITFSPFLFSLASLVIASFSLL